MENSMEMDVFDDDFILNEFAAFFAEEFHCNSLLKCNESSAPSPASSSKDVSFTPEIFSKNRSLAVRRSNRYRKALPVEKKRRERLNKRFIALATLLPHLRKTDKVSIITEAFNYIKKLQLENETLKQRINEDAVVVKKSTVVPDDDDDCSSSNAEESSGRSDEKPSPEIEVKVDNNNVILTILCEKNTEILLRIFNVIAKLDLTIVSAHVMSFADTVFDLVITAQMEERNDMAKKSLAQTLDAAVAIHEKLSSSIKQGLNGGDALKILSPLRPILEE